MKLKRILLLSLFLTGCVTANNHYEPDNQIKYQSQMFVTQLAGLPTAISNNAVASAKVGDELRLYSFLGLEKAKDWQDVSKKAFRFADNKWTQLADLPVPQGRLASIAVTVRNQIYVFGGYTVAEDHSEVSTPEVLRFDPVTESYQRVADIPVPSDDATAFVYQDRYIYLVSGWHDRGNINLIQVYDAETNKWQQATQFPGSAVFGHAGGIIANKMLVCDGVKIVYPKISEGEDAKRIFKMSDECYLGRIDDKDVTRIHWSVVPKHFGPPRYRMAAVGDESKRQIIFVGGSDNPYNFNGIGYDGIPSKPHATVFSYDVDTNVWMDYGKLDGPTMDHRGLIKIGDSYVIIGGMDEKQMVLNNTYSITQKPQ